MTVTTTPAPTSEGPELTEVEVNDLRLSLSEATGQPVETEEVKAFLTGAAFDRVAVRLAADKVAAAESLTQSSVQALYAAQAKVEELQRQLDARVQAISSSDGHLLPTADNVSRGQDGSRQVTIGDLTCLFPSLDDALRQEAAAVAARADYAAQTAEEEAAMKVRDELISRLVSVSPDGVDATELNKALDAIARAGLVITDPAVTTGA